MSKTLKTSAMYGRITTNEYVLEVYFMAYKRKYRPGAKITSLDELEREEFIYCNGKIMHEGWFKSWPFRLANNYIKWGSLRYAVKIKMEEQNYGKE